MFDTRTPSPLLEATTTVLTSILDRPGTVAALSRRLHMTERRIYRQLHYIEDMGFKVYRTEGGTYSIDVHEVPGFISKFIYTQKALGLL